jgi:pyruvate dehydrogenase E1 component
VWAREWDEILARDVDGVLVNQMNTTCDGQFQKYSVESGAYIREHFFGPDPRLRKLVEHLSDEDLRKLPRGGHDYRKLYAAYKAAVEHEGSPTVILAHTIKGWTLGPEFEARNATHQIKKMTELELKTFRDRLHLDIPDRVLEEGDPPYYHPGPKSEELEYMRGRRRALDGAIPERVVRTGSLPAPAGDPFKDFLSGTGDKVKASTTSAFTRLMRNLMKDRQIGKRIVPIIPDEGRTFGLDALFSQAKIYAPFGQKYEPVDAQLVMSYREDRTGQILEEGITEAGSMASFTAAGTAYATWGQPMIPFYIFYSMFGFQRVGDLIWAFGDARGRGFLLGATAGRTTLQGEGLQHDDGHSPVLASTVPNCRVYDPAFAYELAVVIEDGIRRMYGEKPEDCFYYITLYNETMSMPAMPDGARDGILRGLYRYKPAPQGEFSNRARILASGTGMLAALEAQALLAEHHDTGAEVWSATSYKLLRENALEIERWNRLHPTEVPRVPYISHVLGVAGNGGPTVAVSDYMKAVPDQVARWVPGPFITLGTDGYGFSDTRAALRRHFETDAPHVVVATLSGLAQLGDVKGETVAEAIRRYGLDTETIDPREA